LTIQVNRRLDYVAAKWIHPNPKVDRPGSIPRHGPSERRSDRALAKSPDGPDFQGQALDSAQAHHVKQQKALRQQPLNPAMASRKGH
jgi:hypothetical protein